MTDERDAEIKRLRDFETYWNRELVSVIGRMINEAKWLRPRHADSARHPDGGRLVVAMLIVALGAMALTVEVIHGEYGWRMQERFCELWDLKCTPKPWMDDRLMPQRLPPLITGVPYVPYVPRR